MGKQIVLLWQGFDRSAPSSALFIVYIVKLWSNYKIPIWTSENYSLCNNFISKFSWNIIYKVMSMILQFWQKILIRGPFNYHFFALSDLWMTYLSTPPEMLNILSQYIYPKPAFGIYPGWSKRNLIADNHICTYVEDIWTQ